MTADESLAVDLLNWFGTRRFTARDYYRHYHAGSRDDFPTASDLDEIRTRLAAVPRLAPRSPGPRGGEGWQLSSYGVQFAQRLRAPKNPPLHAGSIAA